MSPWLEWDSLAMWASWGERVSMLGSVDMMDYAVMMTAEQS
jgi:hypothetical protein